MSLADELLLDAIQADRAADRARIRYVRDVRNLIARADADRTVPAAPTLTMRLRTFLRVRVSVRDAADRTTG